MAREGVFPQLEKRGWAHAPPQAESICAEGWLVSERRAGGERSAPWEEDWVMGRHQSHTGKLRLVTPRGQQEAL